MIARDVTRQYVYDGRMLGVPMYSHGLWLQCGVLDGEDVVPEAERRHYCGLWFHAACIGILRAPKGNKIEERVQCMRCLQDRRYRVKPPRVDLVAAVALWDAKGSPRILQNEPGGRVSTMHMSCSCGLATGTGLPCEGMLAVTRVCGAVPSFHHYHEHWFSGKLIDFRAPQATFSKNTRLQLDVDAVINCVNKESAPSHVPEEIRPKPIEVIPSSLVVVEPTLVLSKNGVTMDVIAGLAGIEAGDAKSDRKKSRRYKSKVVAPKK